MITIGCPVYSGLNGIFHPKVLSVSFCQNAAECFVSFFWGRMPPEPPTGIWFTNFHFQFNYFIYMRLHFIPYNSLIVSYKVLISFMSVQKYQSLPLRFQASTSFLHWIGVARSARSSSLMYFRSPTSYAPKMFSLRIKASVVSPGNAGSTSMMAALTSHTSVILSRKGMMQSNQ